jgi:2-polyprenyl-3-methyl-5-hydroxy-6-metoxy-1,4-benzoquinol methylase
MAGISDGQAVDWAIEVHSRQARGFAESYRRLEQDPYASCFTYSRMRLDRLLDVYLARRSPGEALLDVGCGTGHQLHVLGARGFEVSGVDGSAAMLVHARENNPHATILQSKVDALPFDDDAFDIVICIEVLRYLPNGQSCISETARVLRPGGLLLATATPPANLNGYAVVNRIASGKTIPGLTPLRQYFTTPQRLDYQCALAGFISRQIHGVYVGPINWVERLAPRAVLRPFLRRWEHVDWALADRPRLRGFANMLMVAAER